jgi:hypothetical protein
MPVPVPNGLLPGRGPAGRGAGFGASGAAESAGAWAAGAAGASGAGAGVGAGAGAAGASGASGTAAVAGVGSGAGAGAAAFLAGAFLAGAAGAAAGIASRSLRATGGSTVDEADFTNSPSSCSFARTSLLVTPSSLASSWTRTFDTTLLSWSGQGAPDRQCKRYTFMLACSWGVHPRTPDPLVPAAIAGVVRRPRVRTTSSRLIDHVPQRGQVQRTDDPESPGERLGPLSAVQTRPGRVHMRSSSRQPTIEVRNAGSGDDDYPNQVRRGGPFPAPDAHAPRPGGSAVRRVYRFVHPAQSAVGSCPPAGAGGPAGGVAVSERISMRHPVSRAARRAFWPSRPMASDNW